MTMSDRFVLYCSLRGVFLGIAVTGWCFFDFVPKGRKVEQFLQSRERGTRAIGVMILREHEGLVVRVSFAMYFTFFYKLHVYFFI